VGREVKRSLTLQFPPFRDVSTWRVAYTDVSRKKRVVVQFYLIDLYFYFFYGSIIIYK